MSSSGVVYHFTDTLALPWILASGELRPNREHLPGIGPIRYLWGSTNQLGDRTARSLRRHHHEGDDSNDGHINSNWDEWRYGNYHLVRFTLPANAFMSWREIVRESDWTPEEVAKLEEYDRLEFNETGHDLWRLRWDPLRLADVIKVETTSYEQVYDVIEYPGRGHQVWRPLDIRRPEKLLLRPKDPKCKGVRIGRRKFYSVRVPETPDGRASLLRKLSWAERSYLEQQRRMAARIHAEITGDWDAYEEEYGDGT